MELEFILEVIENNGYLGLFLWLWVGVFIFPVPNELIVMTVGLSSSLKSLHPALAFIVIYFGILAALTTCYTIGRFIGRPLLQYFKRSKRFSRAIDSSLKLMEKYHAFSLSFSYFVPGIRNFLPFLYGFSKLPYKKFALFAYSGALLWLSLTFTLGYVFGDHIDTIIKHEKELLLGLAAIAVLIIAVRLGRRKRGKEHEKLHDQGLGL
ncbi:DedA family protein [Aeromicrobium ponti]|uniref:Membrane protein DedA with SNARE-associated domain n=1 Tax=Cytobacillus oceanisediminis TaxID=665099 RepID=A0A562K3M4_9BACI|nr:DedA family protein [Cytobacillus oceanisediminis]TWH90029.1 membrane protein DedA with SNARE-associated domain [Cytobacillus oceanisediminis]